MRGPKSAIIAVTLRCNAKCSMCDIWKHGSTDEIQPEVYRRLPASLREANLTGGEPLLRKDLGEVIRSLRLVNPKMRIVLSTNGLLPERLSQLLEESGDISVRVSIDAIGEKHDAIRGVEGAYERALRSIEVAIKHGVNDIGICTTITRENSNEADKVQMLAASYNISFTATVAHSSPIFFGDQSKSQPDPLQAIETLIKISNGFYRSSKVKDWFKGYFIDGLIDVIKGSPRPILCHAGEEFFYLDPEGNIFPCHLWEKSIGNITLEAYDEIIGRNPDLSDQVRRCNRRCWMTCTVAPEIRRSPLKPLFHVIKRKIGILQAG